MNPQNKTIRRAIILALACAATGVAASAVLAAPAKKSDMPGAHVHARSGMNVSIKVRKDMMKGHNLFVTTKNFRWAPEHASGKHVRGEGHAHLMIDGVKVTRLYGPAYYIGDLAPGTHTIEVSLNANTHAAYMHGDKAIADSVSVTVPTS